jgi:hypothetical protein
MNQSDGGLGWLLFKIGDCARMCLSSARNRRSARTGRRPRKFERYSSKYPPTSANVGKRPLRAPRANHVFCTDQKRIRTENMVMVDAKRGVGVSDNIAALRHLRQWQ